MIFYNKTSMKVKKISQKKLLSILISLLIIVVYRIFFPQPPTNQNNLKVTIPTSSSTPSMQASIVKRVIDGDTVELEDGKIVRYIGIDAPELHHPTKSVQCFASASAEFNKKLVEGKNVRLEKDVSETDKYKRLLRYVYLIENQVSSSSGLFVNEYLVKEGYAYAATFPPDVKYSELFRQTQEEAMKNNKGLWKACKN